MKTFFAALAAALLCSAASAADVSGMFKPAPAADAPMAAGRKAVAKQDWNTALKDFSAAVAQDPNSADAHNMLAYTNRKLKRYDEAFKHYEIALRIDPKHRGAHEYMGEAYAETGKLAEAQTHLKALESICGTSCEEYRDLAEAIARAKAKS